MGCKTARFYIYNTYSIGILNGAKTLLGSRNKGVVINWLVYMEIMKPVAWGVLFLALFIVAMALVLYNYQTYDRDLSGHQQMQRMSVQEYKITFLASLFVALRMLLNLDFQLQVKSYASMIIILSGSLLGYLFWSMYTSDLTAKMTTNPPPLPIRQVKHHALGRCIILISTIFQCSSFADVFPRGYQVVTSAGTAGEELLRKAPPGTAMRKV